MDDCTPSVNPDRILVELEQWRSLADMLAFTLSDKYGAEHHGCSEEFCAVAFVLAKHAEMVDR